MLPHPKRRCVTCKKQPAIFGIRQQERCEAHRLHDDSNLVHRTCLVCGLPDVLDDHGRCSTCDPDVFLRTRLAKQREVLQYLRQNMPEHTPCSVDKVPASLKECGDLYRPDALWDTNPLRSVILEVDENQHRERACECEQARMVNIAGALGAPQTVFVRYNPDEYAPLTKGTRQRGKQDRLNVLRRWLKHFIECTMDASLAHASIAVLYLFFDGHDEASTVPRVLIEMHCT